MSRVKEMLRFPFRYARYALNSSRPIWATFALTENCNARCEYCQYWRKKHPELTTEQVNKVIRGLKDIGILNIVFSGGECLLRSDLPEAVSFSKSLGLQATLVSNGLIDDKELFLDLMQRGLDGLAFSLDGSNAETHEAFRRGCSFDKVISSVEKAVRIRDENSFKTRIATTTVVHRGNMGDLKNIYTLRKSLGADKNYFQPVWPIFGEDKFMERFGFEGMEAAELEGLAEELSAIPDGNLKGYYDLLPDMYLNFSAVSDKYRCYAGRAFVFVDSAGILYPCSPLVKEPIGSLLDEDIKKILSSPEMKKRFQRYEGFSCGGCTMTCYMEKNIVLSDLQNPIALIRRLR